MAPLEICKTPENVTTNDWYPLLMNALFIALTLFVVASNTQAYLWWRDVKPSNQSAALKLLLIAASLIVSLSTFFIPLHRQ